jgi:hypothetical protein
MRTGGRGTEEAETPGEAVDDNIEKTSPHESENDD